LKYGLKYKADNTAIMYKPHLESLYLEEARVNDWLDYIDQFKSWKKYIPAVYIRNIKLS